MNKFATLIIDVQIGLVKGSFNEAQVLDNINRVIQKSRQSNVPVIFIQHCHSTFEPLKRNAPEWAIHPQLELAPDDTVIEKQASDAFYDTILDQTLVELDAECIIVTGLQSEYCIDATCRAALSHHYNVVLVSDAHTTGDGVFKAEDVIKHHNYTLATLAHPANNISLVRSHDLFA